jgi:dolichyl-diphosphooligosaccharide--protein glycosyltransferase
MKRRRVLFLAGLAVALPLGGLLRLQTRQQLSAGPRVRAVSSDDYYHLRRARFASAHFPKTVVLDPLTNFPHGAVAIWPPLFDLALAAPARLLHGPGASAAAVERGAAWVPLVFALGSILLVGLLGRFLYGEAGGVACALFLALCPAHVLWSQYGHVDQHVAESFFGLLVLLLFVRSRESLLPLPPGEGRGEGGTFATSSLWDAATGFALALAVLAWQGAIAWGAVIALSLLLEALLTGGSVFRAAAWMLGAPALLAGAATALFLGPLRVPFTYISFGFFQPLFLAALAGGLVLLETLVRALRRELTRRELATRVLFMALAVFFTLPFSSELARGLLRGVGYVLGKTGEEVVAGGYVSYPRDWLAGIFETRPLLAEGPGLAAKQLSAAFFLSPLVLLLWAGRALRRNRPGEHVALAVWGGVSLFLALSQRLNVYYAAPLSAFCLVEAAILAGRALARARGRTSPALASCAAALLLALPMLPGIREEARAVRVPGSDLFDTLDWMREHLPREVDAYDPRLLDPSASGEVTAAASSVLAPWSLGHLILYNAEVPVVANNFGYGFLDSIRFFLAGSEEEALAIAARRRARWVLATDLAPRMNDYASYLDRPPLLREGAQGLIPTPSYFSTLQSRLYDFDGRGGELPGLTVRPLGRFRLLYRSKSAILRGGRWVARWKVFEILPAQGLGGP